MFSPHIGTAQRGLVGACWAYLLNAGIGTWYAISHEIPGRPLGLQTGLPVALDFVVGLGSGLSAPLAMLIALTVLTVSVTKRESQRTVFWIGVLGSCFLVGMLIEPILWEVLKGDQGPLSTAVVIANTLLPIAMLALAVRITRDLQKASASGGTHISGGVV